MGHVAHVLKTICFIAQAILRSVNEGQVNIKTLKVKFLKLVILDKILEFDSVFVLLCDLVEVLKIAFEK